MSEHQAEIPMWKPLDLAQYERIRWVHHGYLYQHLICASLIVQTIEDPGPIAHLRFESDEDVEIKFQNEYLYLQIKSSQDPFIFSEAASAVVRFHKLHLSHTQGQRGMKARFGLAVGGALGLELSTAKCNKISNELKKKLATISSDNGFEYNEFMATWQKIEWYTEGDLINPFSTVKVCRDVSALYHDLKARLNKVIRLSHTPETTALMLAAAVNMIVSDSFPNISNRVLSADRCRALITRVAVATERLPSLPLDYIEPKGKPRLLSAESKMCLVGVSGSGKSTYISAEALKMQDGDLIYLRPRGDEPTALLTDLCAQLAEMLSPKLSSMDVAKALSTAISLEERFSGLLNSIDDGTYVVIDDAHRLPTGHPVAVTLLKGLASRNRVGLLLSTQPERSDGSPSIPALLRTIGQAIKVLNVPSWDHDDVARWVASHGSQLSIDTATKIAEFSGGHPLATTSLYDLAKQSYFGDFEAAMNGINLGAEPCTPRAIMEASYLSLSATARQVACTLALVGFTPLYSEICELVAADTLSSGLRMLFEKHVIRRIPRSDGQLSIELHETYLSLIESRMKEELSPEIQRKIHIKAAELLEKNLRSEGFRLTRVLALYNNLLLAGKIEEVTDYLTSSFISADALTRYGLGKAITGIVKRSLIHCDIKEERFWLRDTLLFLYYKEYADEAVTRKLWQEQEEDYKLIDNPSQAIENAFNHKRLLWEGRFGKLSAAKRAWHKLRSKAVDVNDSLVADYSLATIYHTRGNHSAVLDLCADMIQQYCKLLGFGNFMNIWTEKAEDIRMMITAKPALADRWLVQLGDCMDLAGRSLYALKQSPVSMFSHACTLYNIGFALEPLLRSNLALADLLVADGRTAHLALEFLLPLLDMLKREKLTFYLLEVTAWAALAAARTGKTDVANRLLAEASIYDLREAEDVIRKAKDAIDQPPPQLPVHLILGGGPINAAFMRKLGFGE